IIGINLQTKFHGVLTRKNAPSPRSHVFQPTGIIFDLVQDIIGMNLLAKFHEDRTVNVASRVKNAPSLGSHFFQANMIIFKHIQDIIETNLQTKFHEDWTINVAYRPYMEKCPTPGDHVLKATKTIFELIQDIIGTNLLTKFHDDRKINVTSRVLTRKIALPPWWPYIIGINLQTKFHEDRTINVASREKCPAPWRPCFSSKHWTINVASRVLTRKNAPPPGGHVFQPTGIIFQLFYEDWTINVASRVKNAPPLGSHVFQANVTIFELIQDIIETKLLTKFHEDFNKANVDAAQRTTDDGQKAITKAPYNVPAAGLEP
ncbi:hypothetical protein DPMN_051307, partial [Dreissena polymorpha]